MMRIAAGLRAATFFGLLACGFCGGNAMEKQGEVRHVAVPKAEPRPEDVSTIEGIVKASYETISGGVGVPRQWGRDRTLFDPNSRSVAVGVNSKTGAVTTHGMTEQEYADEEDA